MQTYVSTRHPATLRRGSVATMHRFRPADLRTACSRRMAMVYRVAEAESAPALRQYRLCDQCARLEPLTATVVDATNARACYDVLGQDS